LVWLITVCSQLPDQLKVICISCLNTYFMVITSIILG